jgi:hypothetical protein
MRILFSPVSLPINCVRFPEMHFPLYLYEDEDLKAECAIQSLEKALQVWVSHKLVVVNSRVRIWMVL